MGIYLFSPSFGKFPAEEPHKEAQLSPCCPRDSQESSPTPQFKSIHSSVLSFLYQNSNQIQPQNQSGMSLPLSTGCPCLLCFQDSPQKLHVPAAAYNC